MGKGLAALYPSLAGRGRPGTTAAGRCRCCAAAIAGTLATGLAALFAATIGAAAGFRLTALSVRTWLAATTPTAAEVRPHGLRGRSEPGPHRWYSALF